MRTHKSLLLSACVGAALSMAVGTAAAGTIRGISDQNTPMVPTGKGYGRPATPGELADGRLVRDARSARPSKGGGNGISYHGGPVMLGTVNAYYIWYGNWSGNSATTILTNLMQSFGGTPYYNINTTYYDGSNNHVSNAIHYAGTTTVGYTYGTALSDANIQSIVQDAISSNALPKDTNAVYFVLTSADVNESSGFCSQYCGWHTNGSILGSTIKYSFVGNPDRCPSSCAAQTTGPNGNAGADGMASIISHELEETTSDPLGNAWYDTRGYENADKCAWTFGTESTAANGSKYNVTMGGKQYLIQQNWVNASGGSCKMSY